MSMYKFIGASAVLLVENMGRIYLIVGGAFLSDRIISSFDISIVQ